MSKPKTERVNKAVKCDICNLTLNSELQAQQHYNGKNHLKKMKQLGMPLPGEDEGKKVIQQYTSEANSEGNEDSSQSGDAPEGQGSQSEETEGSIEDKDAASPSGASQTSQSSTPTTTPSGEQQAQHVPSSQDNDEGQLQTADSESQLLDAKDPQNQQLHSEQNSQQQQQQQSQQQSTSTSTDQQQQQPEKLDPVSQAVYDNILGKLPRKRKMEIPCSVCDMIFNSEAQASQHFRGVKHAKRLKMSEDFKPTSKSGSDGEGSPDVSCSEGNKSACFYCHYCGVGLNSTQQLEEHKEGQLHKKMVERKGPGGQGRRSSDEVAGCQPGMMHCKVCDISVPSPSRMQQHMSSLEHQERAASNRPGPMVDEAPDSPASSSSSSQNQLL